MNALRPGPSWVTVLAMLLLAPWLSSAQEPPSEAPEAQTQVFFSGGVGAGTLSGFAAQLSLSIRRGGGDVVVRMAGTTEFVLFDTPETSKDIAVLYGRHTSGSIGWVRAAAGLGAAWGVRRGALLPGTCFFGCDYVQKRHSTVGLALQVDAAWAPMSSMALGLSLFGNLNGLGSFGVATLSVHVGQVR